MKTIQAIKRLLLPGGLLLAALLAGLALAAPISSVFAQATPPGPPALPSSPPTQPTPVAPPAPSASAIPTVAPPLTPPPVGELPTSPPTNPTPPAPSIVTSADPEPARVTVVLRPDGSAPRRGGSLTMLVVATNRGRGSAEDVLITMPFDSARVRVVDAVFSRPGVWVSSALTSTLELRTGPMADHSDTVTATIRLAVLDTAPEGGDLIGRAALRWADRAGGGEGRSNRVELSVGGPARGPVAALTRTESPEGNPVFGSGIFAPGEPVALWYQQGTGQGVAVEQIVADDEGRITYTLDADLAPGAYTMVAYGHWTEFTAAAPFSVR